MPPARTSNSLEPTRGLTQTIRCARRARRSISRPDERRIAALPAVRDDHDDRPARHAAAAVAVVELLQRVADPRPARPIWRGGRGALDRAVGTARRERSRDPGQARREDERLGARPRAGGAGEKLQVGARVRLHRPGDVAEHHQPPRDLPPLAARKSDGVAPCAQAPAQRPPHVDAVAASRTLVAARAPHGRRQVELGHQPVEAGELVWLERVEALGGEDLVVARHRQRHVDLRRVRARRPLPTHPSRPSRSAAPSLSACAADERSLAGRVSAGAGSVRASVDLRRGGCRGATEDLGEDARRRRPPRRDR